MTGHLLNQWASLRFRSEPAPLGPEHLIRAAELHVKLGLRTLTLSWWSLTLPVYYHEGESEAEVIRLARTDDVEPLTDADRQALIARLRQFPPQTLKALLPVATHARRVLCEALGWNETLAIVEQISDIAEREYSGAGSDVPNAPDPDCGVIDAAVVRAALTRVDPETMRAILRLFSAAKVAQNTAVLIQAVAGWNRADIEKGLKKHRQIAIKAYGLLPLERGTEEVLERYLALQGSAREGQKFGAQRRASHAAAVRAALSNLAQVAGYTDASRLEWDMEARIGQAIAPSGRTWHIDDYELQLVVEGVEVSLATRRNDRVLKSVPKGVKASSAYREAREAVSRLRGQVSRLRQGLLEPLIASGEPLTPDELVRLLRLPIARPLLECLIFRAEDGVTGLFEPDTMSLRGLDGTAHSISAPVSVAHPYHLYQANVLAAWQREIVRRRIVQPIRQAYRELYLLTPAEQDTGDYSNRFAGHVVDGRVAARLLSTRGWRFERSAGPLPYKGFAAHGLRAVFEFPDVDHFFGETTTLTADRIYFQRYPMHRGFYTRHDDNRLPLEQVPPILFSEVMRDADLVVSVAQREGEAHLSAESYERRGDLVKALLDDLGLPGVEVDGHFAYVKGKLANYRIHLGSAVIHIEPGNYLCIVPDRWSQHHERLFLPFADEQDHKVSEVISKVLLLLADDRITDPSILRQIRR
jgi:Domain of unknown function (DUF4132)/Family of unknown function (DUF5724)